MPFDFFSWYLDLIEQRRLASTIIHIMYLYVVVYLYYLLFLLIAIKKSPI